MHNDLSTFTTNSTSQLDVLWHDGGSLGAEGHNSGTLETQVNQEFSRLSIATDLTKRH